MPTPRGTVQAVASVRLAKRHPGTSKGGFGMGPKTITLAPSCRIALDLLAEADNQTGLYGVKL